MFALLPQPREFTYGVSFHVCFASHRPGRADISRSRGSAGLIHRAATSHCAPKPDATGHRFENLPPRVKPAAEPWQSPLRGAAFQNTAWAAYVPPWFMIIVAIRRNLSPEKQAFHGLIPEHGSGWDSWTMPAQLRQLTCFSAVVRGMPRCPTRLVWDGIAVVVAGRGSVLRQIDRVGRIDRVPEQARGCTGSDEYTSSGGAGRLTQK